MEKKYKRIPFDLELAKAITKGWVKGRIMANVGKGNIELFTLPFLEVPDEQEFKEGDVVMYSKFQVAIYNKDLQRVFAWTTLKGEKPRYDDTFFTPPVRLATPEEKQLLIDALKKDNSDKAREYLKRFFGIDAKPKFNAKDWVLVRNYEDKEWKLDIYSHYNENWGNITINGYQKFCIPYNEQTKHLLGTTDDWEG